jgi:hypothetical protein
MAITTAFHLCNRNLSAVSIAMRRNKLRLIFSKGCLTERCCGPYKKRDKIRCAGGQSHLQVALANIHAIAALCVSFIQAIT